MPAVITPMQRARWAPLLCLLPLAVTAIYDEDPLLEEARKSGNLAPLAAARHARALEIDSHNDPALAMLRSAVRMKPDVANYWNDLGLICGPVLEYCLIHVLINFALHSFKVSGQVLRKSVRIIANPHVWIAFCCIVLGRYV